MTTIYNSNQNEIWEIIIEGKKIAVFNESDYPEIFKRNVDGSLVHEPKITFQNSSVNGMTAGKLAFGSEVEFNFSLYTHETPGNYLGKQQILLFPRILIKKVWPISGEELMIK